MAAKISLIRHKGFADIMRGYRILIDDLDVGKVKNGGRFECDVTSVFHTLQLKN